MLEFLRGLIKYPSKSQRKRSCILRLECLEAREVPSIQDTPIGGDLMKGDVDRFPAKAQELPSGTVIEVWFGGSPDPRVAYKASVTLRDPNGAGVATKTPESLTSKEHLSIKYVIQSKTSGLFAVDVKNAGPVAPNNGVVPYWGTAKIKLPDITVSGAKYIGGSEKDHKNPTGVEVAFKVTGGDPSKFKEKFKIGLYRSADGKTPGSKLTEMEVSGAGQTIKLDTKSPLHGLIAQPYLVVVADKDKKVEEENEGNNSTKLDLPPIGLQIDPGDNGLTLMDNESFTITTGSATVSGYRVEVRQRGEGDTDYVSVASGTSSQLTVVPRLAEEVDYLPSAVVSGTRFFGAPRKVTVQYPEIGTIVGDSKVKAAADDLWSTTKGVLSSSNGQQWREFGSLVHLNTETGTYFFDLPPSSGPINTFDAKGKAGRATVPIPGPVDHIDTAKKTGVYVVAWFHTHPQELWKAKALDARKVGPSDVDIATSHASGLPALVYDYDGAAFTIQSKGKVIFADVGVRTGMDLNSAAHIYTAGPARRRI